MKYLQSPIPSDSCGDVTPEQKATLLQLAADRDYSGEWQLCREHLSVFFGRPVFSFADLTNYDASEYLKTLQEK